MEMHLATSGESHNIATQQVSHKCTCRRFQSCQCKHQRIAIQKHMQ